LAERTFTAVRLPAELEQGLGDVAGGRLQISAGTQALLRDLPQASAHPGRVLTSRPVTQER
jgi:hypothetical protein